MACAAISLGERMATAGSVEALWLEFVSDRSPRLRDRLILQYAWLVKHVLGRLAVVLPPSLDYGDLMGHGTIALVEAVDRFEPERGNKFETYAVLKIKGAILDAVRAMDFVSRPVRRRMKQVSETVANLTRDLGRTPNDAEVAKALSIPLPALFRLYQRGAATVVSLDAVPVMEAGEDDVALHEALADANQVDPAFEAVRSEMVSVLAEVIDSLGERDQLVLSLYYTEGLNMREIGQVLGISESRVCQIHGRALTYLRASLGRRDPDLARESAVASARALAGA
jgi:RNA polymerase sigma factor for flagellar operon FliA